MWKGWRVRASGLIWPRGPCRQNIGAPGRRGPARDETTIPGGAPRAPPLGYPAIRAVPYHQLPVRRDPAPGRDAPAHAAGTARRPALPPPPAGPAEQGRVLVLFPLNRQHPDPHDPVTPPASG